MRSRSARYYWNQTSPSRSEYEMSNLDAAQKNHVRKQQPSSPGGWSFTESYVDGDDEPGTSVLDSSGCPTQDDDFCDRQEICVLIVGDSNNDNKNGSIWQQAKFISSQITIPVQTYMFLLFSNMFTVESVISACSMVAENRWGHWVPLWDA